MTTSAPARRHMRNAVDLPITSPDLLQKSGLDWKVEELGMYRNDMVPVTSKKCLVRSDTRAEVGFVGKGYNVMQHEEMVNLFRDVAGIKDMTIDAAGSVRGGSIVWMIAKCDDLILRKGDDVSQGYLQIINSHDGSGSLLITPETIRFTCMNQLRMVRHVMRNAKGELTSGYKVRHTSRMKLIMADIADAYARSFKDYEATRNAFSLLTSRPLSSKAFETMMAAAFKNENSGDESDRARTIAENRTNSINRILASETCNVKGTAGTLWSGLNAITEYIDHERPTRGNADENRFVSATIRGTGVNAKARAFEAAMALI